MAVSKTAPALSIAAGGTFDITNAPAYVGVKDLIGAAGSKITLGAQTLTIHQANDDTFAGTISGAGGLTVAGTGTLNLTGTNAYTGRTVINSGTLVLGDGGCDRHARRYRG